MTPLSGTGKQEKTMTPPAQVNFWICASINNILRFAHKKVKSHKYDGLKIMGLKTYKPLIDHSKSFTPVGLSKNVITPLPNFSRSTPGIKNEPSLI